MGMLLRDVDLRDLPRARHPLRELHPSDHDPVRAAVRGHGRAADAAASSTCELNMYAFVGIIMLIGIVKKNAIMMIDFAIEAQRKRRQAPARRDLRGVPRALPPDHDDHDGRADGHAADRARLGRGRRGAPAAGPRGGRRAAALAAPDALHHAGHLPLSREIPQPRGGARRAREAPAPRGQPHTRRSSYESAECHFLHLCPGDARGRERASAWDWPASGTVR